MRGGAQSHLIECDDGAYYIVKYTSNPQHRRILVNELVASVMLRYLQISSPDVAVIEIGEEFVRDYPEAAIKLGTRSSLPEPGWHFGSKHPGDPALMATYDFVPDQLLGQVHNIRDFLGALVFDKWTGNADGRQAVFFRAQISEWLPAAEQHPRKMGFVALMIDHGYIFNGPHWDYVNSPVQGLYARKLVYDQVKSIDDFSPWLERVIHFPEEVIDDALRRLPPQWVAGEEEQFEKILQVLMRRRKRVPEMIAEARLAKTNPFANWPL